MKAYITKNALTEGIFEVEAEICKDISITMIRVTKDQYGNKPKYPTTYHNKDWHKTKTAALAHANKMRSAKIISLRKSIAKLETLKFE